MCPRQATGDSLSTASRKAARHQLRLLALASCDRELTLCSLYVALPGVESRDEAAPLADAA
jgi:hypothetical protein